MAHSNRGQLPTHLAGAGHSSHLGLFLELRKQWAIIFAVAGRRRNCVGSDFSGSREYLYWWIAEFYCYGYGKLEYGS